MSIRAVTDLAAARDMAAPDDTTAGVSDTLIKTVPTESLAAYTTFIAVVESLDSADDPLLDWRWAAFLAFVGLTLITLLASYYWKARSTRPAGLPSEQRWGRWLPVEVV